MEEKTPVTPATRFLDKNNVSYVPHVYSYQDKGGAGRAAVEVGAPLSLVIKTLVFEDDNGKPFLVLMGGHQEVSTKNLARKLKAKSVQPCSKEKVKKVTGYQVGGVSPFGVKNLSPVLAEEEIFNQPKVFINGGKRGFLVEISTQDLDSLLRPQKVQVAI